MFDTPSICLILPMTQSDIYVNFINLKTLRNKKWNNLMESKRNTLNPFFSIWEHDKKREVVGDAVTLPGFFRISLGVSEPQPNTGCHVLIVPFPYSSHEHPCLTSPRAAFSIPYWSFFSASPISFFKSIITKRKPIIFFLLFAWSFKPKSYL